MSSSIEEETAFYSVWAVPPEPLKERLQKLMGKLRDEFGGPAFEPHITVVGAIRLPEKDALQKLRSSCEGIKSYTVRINSVGRGTFFYQSVYLLVDPTPEVVEASHQSSSHFGYQRSTTYMPHLSLLYGGLSDEEKEKAVEMVKLLDPEICNASFDVSRLTLYKTDTQDTTLESWEKIDDCNLSGGGN
ncbi:cyclic phosphodiesterase-like [Aristolochia californica]|uniref:cyclic phosphodiesterase-like n=1 Tax=Aristolochia californica TaxID=171875 RepID=UPI0035DCD1B3